MKFEPYLLEGKFKTFSDAQRKCRSGTYDTADEVSKRIQQFEAAISQPNIGIPASYHLAKLSTNHALRPDRMLPLLAALSIIKSSNEIRVLDVGGDWGRYYHALRACFGKDNFDPIWDIVEVEKLVQNSELLGKSKRKRFYSNLSQVKDFKYDLIICQRLLQIVPNPEDFLNQVREVKSEYLLITGFPLHPVIPSDRICIHRSSGGFDIPYHVFCSRWEAILRRLGDVIFDYENINEIDFAFGEYFFRRNYFFKRQT